MIEKRVERVVELLLASNETISNITYDCQFKTLAHLSRVFNVKYGVTPTEYRTGLVIK
ncbi:MAG: helix-turn-helix transcriptional regulator [Flavobacteriales bacterium]|nr:helix-turn-helix transcriptional regulator [Flavobacteriales bacterium]